MDRATRRRTARQFGVGGMMAKGGRLKQWSEWRAQVEEQRRIYLRLGLQNDEF